MQSKKCFVISKAFLLVLFIQPLLVSNSFAIPAFARQMNTSCTSCHSQHFPTLNSFGRLFKATGYTMVVGQDQVKGNGMSLPQSLNASIVGDLQYIKGDEQEVGFPAALSLYLAGKASDKAGFILEIPFEDKKISLEDNSGNSIEGETNGAVAQFGSFKTSYVDQVGGFFVGGHAFSTEAAGPAYGYELLSTGALGMNVAQTGANAMGAIGIHREHGATLMSQFMGEESTGPSAGAATGFGLSLQNRIGFIYASSYIAKQKIEHIENPTFGKYIRAAWTPSFAGFEIGTGFQLYFGESTSTTGKVGAKATTFDFQAQGQMLGKPVGFYATYASAPKSTSTLANQYNRSSGGDNSSIGLLTEVGIIDKLSVSLSFVNATFWTDVEQKGTSTTIGTEYLFLPNVRFAIRYASFGGDLNDSSMIATVYAGL